MLCWVSHHPVPALELLAGRVSAPPAQETCAASGQGRGEALVNPGIPSSQHFCSVRSATSPTPCHPQHDLGVTHRQGTARALPADSDHAVPMQLFPPLTCMYSGGHTQV